MPPLKFDPEATVEEIAGIGRHPRFDAVIDDKDDRTIQTFAKIAQEVGADSLPHHYAILPCPADPDQKTKLEHRLADAHISAIWYPEGEHNHVEQILELLTY